MAKQFAETVFMERAPRVDRERGIVEGIKFVGMTSKNKRDYTEALKGEKAVALYDGVKVYANHPLNESGERRIEDWVGVTCRPRREADGIYGDVQLRLATPHAEPFMEAAEKFYKHCGMSHIADGESRMAGDMEMVESLSVVHSVDLVTDPATTKGLFESVKRPQSKTVKTTLKAATESLPKDTPHRAYLIENMNSGILDAELAVETPEAADPLTQVLSLLKSAMDALVTVAKKDGPPPQESDDMAAEAKQTAAPNGQPQADQQQALVAESVKKLQEQADRLKSDLAQANAERLLLKEGIDPTPARIKALAAAAESDRGELVKSWPKKEANRSDDWPSASPPKQESTEGDGADYEKRFQESIKRANDKLAKRRG